MYFSVIIPAMSRQPFNSKRDRFKTLAENRTNTVLNSIRILRHCANRNMYEYESLEIERIFKVIEEALNEARAAFKDKKLQRFKL